MTDESFSSGSDAMPTVTMVIATLNEIEHIGACLKSLFDQTYPSDKVEIIVADGGSSDGTVDAVKSFMASHRVKLVHNDQRVQSAGYNRALRKAAGKYVGLVSAHSVLARSYIRECVDLAMRTGAVNVGGPRETDRSEASYAARAIAVADVMPLVIGGARHRYGHEETDVDSVFPGFFLREALLKAGGFDETLPVHEDYELNYRLRSAGGKIRFSPKIVVHYRARSSFASLARQYFRWGRGKSTVAKLHPGVMRPHHIVPPLLVATLFGAPLLGRLGRRCAKGTLGAYLAFICLASLAPDGKVDWKTRLRLPVAIATMQICWGAGFWYGLALPLRIGPPLPAVADST